ncbi:MAG TPA: hypothetical protein PKG52_00530 [bacterium]|nr:hypothetical protein [bacterium]HPS29024.1 hypothetical protein [bacterium]
MRFHTKSKDIKIFQTLDKLFSDLKIADIKCLKPSFLDEKAVFTVKLLRAAMMPESVMLIDRPFFMIKNMADIRPVRETLALLDTHFSKCIITDYEWHSGRYGDLIEQFNRV